MRVGRTIHCTLLVIAVMALSFEVRCDHLMKQQSIENPNGLQKFFTSLHQSAEQSPDAFTRIIHYGDSHVAADWWTGKLRRSFYQDFGREFMSYEAKGRNGARATDPLKWDWEAIADGFVDNPPALIVVAYGTNEAGDSDLDLGEYKAQFERLLQHYKEAAPDASLLVIAPPDRAIFRRGQWRTLARLPELIATQREATLNEGAAFWNQFAAIGGAGSSNRWANRTPKLAQKDRVHLTLAGYELIADSLYAELMREYELYQQQTTKE